MKMLNFQIYFALLSAILISFCRVQAFEFIITYSVYIAWTESVWAFRVISFGALMNSFVTDVTGMACGQPFLTLLCHPFHAQTTVILRSNASRLSSFLCISCRVYC